MELEPTPPPSAIVDALLGEIAERLGQFIRSQERSMIDLRSLPVSPDDLDRLQHRLGRGEVSIQLDVAGRSEVWETAYAGVWWVLHHGADGSPLSELIEISDVPMLVPSPIEDIERALTRLTEHRKTQGAQGAMT